jgi:CRISPR-associated endonuclease Cas2
VAYDVADDRQRERLALVLSDVGQRIGLSLFQVELARHQLQALLARIEPLVIPASDRIHIFHLCLNCEKAARLLGKPWPRVRRDVLVC